MYFPLLIFTCAVLVQAEVTIFEADPPKPTNHALIARQIIHSSDWVSLSTISTIPTIKSFPYTNLESIVDGVNEEGNGVPYFFVTALDPSVKDITADNRCSVMASLAQGDWCKKYDIDQEDPRCSRVMLSGNFLMVDNKTEEYTLAMNNMFNRHPESKIWENFHTFVMAKLDIKYITLFDWFGGLKNIDLTDYFNANENNVL